MDDPFTVSGFETVSDPLEQRQRLIDGNGPSRNELGERFTFDELHHQKLHVAGLFEPVESGDVGVVQRGKELGFPLETSQALFVLSELSRQDFDRHISTKRRVLGPIDLSSSR